MLKGITLSLYLKGTWFSCDEASHILFIRVQHLVAKICTTKGGEWASILKLVRNVQLNDSSVLYNTYTYETPYLNSSFEVSSLSGQFVQIEKQECEILPQFHGGTSRDQSRLLEYARGKKWASLNERNNLCSYLEEFLAVNFASHLIVCLFKVLLGYLNYRKTLREIQKYKEVDMFQGFINLYTYSLRECNIHNLHYFLE